jgi:hypothetical protein
MHCHTESMGHGHTSAFAELEFHGLSGFDGDIELYENFFSSCIRSIICFVGEESSIGMAVDNLVVSEC